MPTRVTDQTAKLIDHIHTTLSDKVNQSRIMDLDSDHDLIYCTEKTSILKYHKHMRYPIGQWDTHGYSAKKYLENLTKVAFPNYLTYTCRNDAYFNFIYRFVEAINFIAPVKKRLLWKWTQNFGLTMKLYQQYKGRINPIKNSRILV